MVRRMIQDDEPREDDAVGARVLPSRDPTLRATAPTVQDKAVTKPQAARFILNVLRSPISLMTRPTREEALELATRFEVTAADLIELAAEWARNI